MEREVLGVRINDIDLETAIDQVSSWLETGAANNCMIVVTPGPEFLVTAQNDSEFKGILNTANLAIPDGFGLRLAGIKNRIPGPDFMLRLCQKAETQDWSIGLLGGDTGVAKKAADNLIRSYPRINIQFAIDGEKADQILCRYNLKSLNPVKNQETVIGNNPVDILFVAFGHPRQEKLLSSLKSDVIYKRNPPVQYQIGVGVGGAFDYISGCTPRAPLWLRERGLEWVFRLIQEPKRIKRIVTAVGIFPLLIFLEKITKNKNRL